MRDLFPMIISQCVLCGAYRVCNERNVCYSDDCMKLAREAREWNKKRLDELSEVSFEEAKFPTQERRRFRLITFKKRERGGNFFVPMLFDKKQQGELE